MDNKIFIDEASEILRVKQDRRDFMKKILMGTAATALSSLSSSALSRAASMDATKSTVSFVTGTDRRDMIYQALKPFKKEIKKKIKDKQIILKPNLVGNETIYSVSHPDAVRGILDFLKPIYNGQVHIAESTGRRYDGRSGTMKHFELYDYFPLENEYNAKLVDLNTRPFAVQWVLGKEGHPLDIRIIDSFLDPNIYLISLCRLKSHNALVVTLSAKNVLMAAPYVNGERHDKGRMHSPGIRKMNFNVFMLAQKIQPQLAVIDGVEGFEGNMPADGSPVEHGVVLAGTDFIAVDRIGCQVMGVDFGDCGYLTYCANAGIGRGDLSKIKIKGPDPADHIIKYKMHDSFEKQLEWKN